MKWLFEKFRNKEMSDDEVFEYMRENHLLMEMSAADFLIDNLNSVRNSSMPFQCLVDTSQRAYLNYLSVGGASEEGGDSFLNYVNWCIRKGTAAGKRLKDLNRKEQDEFWNLVNEISEQLKDI